MECFTTLMVFNIFKAQKWLKKKQEEQKDSSWFEWTIGLLRGGGGEVEGEMSTDDKMLTGNSNSSILKHAYIQRSI